ncbi:MAG: DUF1592 domain-containing protein [Verrucomicrobiota bacterium]|nr:DUF1592 domain-containing protein [Verrucomicrobiota bacterium]
MLLTAMVLVMAPGRSVVSSDLEVGYTAKVRPLLDRYCFDCHEGEDAEAEVDLDSFETLVQLQRDTKTWVKVEEMLSSRQMPPEKSDQPTDEESTILQQWVEGFLTKEARVLAGDPGRVVLRRLNNDEYNYSVRDLTGVPSLNPTHEFPVDGGAGEGFTNAGDALGMSPALVNKFLNAGKEVARHVVLLPDGIRFSEHTTERDRADEIMARIHQFYARHVNVNLQLGDTWDDPATAKANVIRRNGSIPLEAYFTAALTEREALGRGQKSIADAAAQHGLNAKYFQLLWNMLNREAGPGGSPVLNRIRELWRKAKGTEAKVLVETVHQWQQALWRFDPIGHIGREGGPTAWMNPEFVTRSTQDFSIKLTPPEDGGDVVVYLGATNTGDGDVGDFVRWQNPRLTGGNKPDLALCNVPGLAKRLTGLHDESHALTTRYLHAVAEAEVGRADIGGLAKRHDLEADVLAAWLDYLAFGPPQPVTVTGLFTRKLERLGGSAYVNGWGLPETPSVVANSSDAEYRIPGLARPHGVELHPSPTLFVAVGWKSPIEGQVTVSAKIADAHVNCGNGGEWWVQHHTSLRLGNLGHGVYDAGGSGELKTVTLQVHRGDVVRLVVGPRDGNHACDLTHADMTLTETGGAKREWDVSKDISGNILESNPLKDRHGNDAVWHFYSGKVTDVAKASDNAMSVPDGSLLARWRDEPDAIRRAALAGRIQALATGKTKPSPDSPDATLMTHLLKIATPSRYDSLLKSVKPDERFGRHPLGHTVVSTDLIMKAPQMVELRIPVALAEGRTLVVTGDLEPEHGRDGSVQLSAGLTRPTLAVLSPAQPVITTAGGDTEKRINAGFDDFRDLFPVSICYPQIVPVDEVVTLALYFREDEPMQRLMLNDAEKEELDRLWDELLYITKEPFKKEVAYEQIVEFSTQDRPDLVIAWKPYKRILLDEVAGFRARLQADEPKQLDGVINWANRAWRRALTEDEQEGLRTLYKKLRKREIDHEKAIQLTLARVLTSPAFLYRREKAGEGAEPVAVSATELATRLSYFLWSSVPDAALGQAAASGELTNNDALFGQTRRMLRDPRTRRLAEQFACQWLHIRGFDQNDDKNEQRFPEFVTLRGDMYEESVRFFEDLFRNDGSVLDLLTADHTFLNERLAKHYGIDGVTGGAWQRVEGVQAKGRGGVLGLATVLAVNSGASRTSPILRGNWVYETLLGEKLPRPPADVPQLPESVPSGLTARQLIEKHSSVPECAKCHERIDPYGFALEQFDPIGRQRPAVVDTRTQLADGTRIEGLRGLREHLATKRMDDVLEQFCRKLLGYALGREVALSDRLFIEEMQQQLKANDYRFSAAVKAVVLSPQFRKIRGQLAKNED